MAHLQVCPTQVALAFGWVLFQVRASAWLLHLWVAQQVLGRICYTPTGASSA